MGQWVWMGALIYLGLAAWFDWRARRIPNRLTVPGFLCGIALNAAAWGWDGVWTSLGGAALMLALLLPLVIFRGLGAGDWKLMGGVGAFLGAQQTLLVFVGTIFVAGVMAIVQITLRRRWLSSLSNLGELARGAFFFRLRPHPVISLDNPKLLRLPFGVAAAFSAGLCYLLILAFRSF